MHSRRVVVLSIVFVALVVGALTVVALRPIPPSLANVLMLLIGLFAMAAVTAFHRLVDTAERRPLVQITFNEGIATTELEAAAKRARLDHVIEARAVGRT